jgi:hypothetical protein
MLIREQQYDFKIKADKVDSLKTRNFLPAEIDWMLNLAIQNFVDNKYGDFEKIQDLTDQLSSLVIKSPTTDQPAVPVTQVASGVYEMKLDDLQFPYLHLVRLNALATKQGCSSKIMKGDEVSHDTLNKVLLSPFEGPNFNWMNLPYVFGKDVSNEGKSSIFFYTNNDFIISEVYPEYIKIPKQVFFGGYNSLNGEYISTDTPVNCDLPPAFHRRIVDIAVAEASDYINKPDYAQKLQKTFTQ